MKLTIQTHSVELTDWLQKYVEKKLGRLDRFLPTSMKFMSSYARNRPEAPRIGK